MKNFALETFPLYGVWYGVAIVHYVAISINGFYRGHLVYHSNVNDCELSLAIYVQGKNTLRKSCIHDNIYLILYYQ